MNYKNILINKYKYYNYKFLSLLINLVKIIDAIEGQLGEQLHEKNIQLKKDIGCQKANLLVNEMLLSRVVFNLVHNAIKFSQEND